MCTAELLNLTLRLVILYILGFNNYTYSFTLYITILYLIFLLFLLLLFVLLILQDTVDILVGWYIDTSQSTETNKRISQCIFHLSTYWTADMSFTLGLLEQLLEDMSLISDKFEQNIQTDGPNGELDKILAYIR